MPLADAARAAIAVVFTGLMIWAGVGDIRRRLIPNRLVLAMLALFVVLAVVNRGEGLVSSLIAFAVALAVGVALWAAKIVGAGDSKLFAAGALFMGVAYLPTFALGTALAGGLVAAVSVASRPQRALAMMMLRGKGDWGPGVPYGVAIAVGGVGVMWAVMTGYLTPFSWTGQTLAASAHDTLRPLALPR